MTVKIFCSEGPFYLQGHGCRSEVSLRSPLGPVQWSMKAAALNSFGTPIHWNPLLAVQVSSANLTLESHLPFFPEQHALSARELQNLKLWDKYRSSESTSIKENLQTSFTVSTILPSTAWKPCVMEEGEGGSSFLCFLCGCSLPWSSSTFLFLETAPVFPFSSWASWLESDEQCLFFLSGTHLFWDGPLEPEVNSTLGISAMKLCGCWGWVCIFRGLRIGRSLPWLSANAGLLLRCSLSCSSLFRFRATRPFCKASVEPEYVAKIQVKWCHERKGHIHEMCHFSLKTCVYPLFVVDVVVCLFCQIILSCRVINQILSKLFLRNHVWPLLYIHLYIEMTET